MTATVTRRTLRRARLGGRHAYRAAARHRMVLGAAVAAAILSVGTAVAADHLPAPVFDGPPAAHMPMHGPMPGGMPGWGDHH